MFSTDVIDRCQWIQLSVSVRQRWPGQLPAAWYSPLVFEAHAAVQYTLAAYQCNSVLKHTSQHGNANAMSQVQLCASPRDSPIPAKTGFADPVQDHMLLVIIDAICLSQPPMLQYHTSVVPEPSSAYISLPHTVLHIPS